MMDIKRYVIALLVTVVTFIITIALIISAFITGEIIATIPWILLSSGIGIAVSIWTKRQSDA